MLSAFIDYSQYGQAIILDQLITSDTPPILVDIGAHDGITGSNSRGLLERGWRGVLLEPMPLVYAQLAANTSLLSNVSVLQAACSNADGLASMRFGKDGPFGQMASLSTDSLIQENLGPASITVPTITLQKLFLRYAVPADFGALLVDTEGLDQMVLQGLDQSPSKPRIIVTEEFIVTNAAKYRFLEQQNYRFVGIWGCDSFWVHHSHPFEPSQFRRTIGRLSGDWRPSGAFAGPGHAHLDPDDYRFGVAAGWAFVNATEEPKEEVVLALRDLACGRDYLFPCWRHFRPDVANSLGQKELARSGFRAFVDVPAGEYQATVIQQGASSYTSVVAGTHIEPSSRSA